MEKQKQKQTKKKLYEKFATHKKLHPTKLEIWVQTKLSLRQREQQTGRVISRNK